MAPATRTIHRLLLVRTTPKRSLATKTKPPFTPSPAPPRLPPDEQAIFERLQQASTGAFSTPTTTAGPTEPVLEASGKGEELHPDVQRGAKPEFEGEVNPKTGEVGGPKNEPLRWGHGGDWSYNGRVTDF
jgi:hypothetical protein